MQNTLHGQHVLITGATGGLGPSIVTACLALGASVLAVGRRRTRLSELASEHRNHERLRTAECDLNHPGAFQKLILANGEAGPVTGVVHCAGAFAYAKLSDVTDETVNRLVEGNLLSSITVLRESLNALAAGGGSIVMIASTRAEAPAAGFGVYGATKAALVHLVQTAAIETEGSAVRVNAVLPGTIDTPQNRRDMPEVDPGRWATPVAIANAVVWLLSADSSGTRGTLVRLPELLA